MGAVFHFGIMISPDYTILIFKKHKFQNRGGQENRRTLNILKKPFSFLNGFLVI